MKVCTSIPETRAACRKLQASGTLGLVPTMGALHAGHMALVRAARERCDFVAASIFVNPTQFGPNEDLDRYPRTFAADCAQLQAAGVALLFAPQAEDMYPAAGSGTFVEVPGIGDRLDGRSRPGHFRGVATVVTKLLNIVGPDRVFFGQKDAAQVAVLQAMVADLNFAVELTVVPTVREPDGLAMSSRNRFLTAPGRARSVGISRALLAVQTAFDGGQRALLPELLQQMLSEQPELAVEYAEFVNPNTLEPVTDLDAGALVAVAARIDGVRLIDNVLLPSGFKEMR